MERDIFYGISLSILHTIYMYISYEAGNSVIYDIWLCRYV